MLNRVYIKNDYLTGAKDNAAGTVIVYMCNDNKILGMVS